MKVFGKLDAQQIEELIHQQVVGRLGCHSEGTTYVVPMSYAYDGNFFYGRTRTGMKLDMLRKNPKVCVQVDDTKNLANWKSAICWGTFEELPEGPEKDEAIMKLSDRILPIISSQTMHISQEWPFVPKDHHDVKGILFRIRIDKKTGRYEQSNVGIFYAT